MPSDPAISGVAKLDEPEHLVDPGRVGRARHGLDAQVVTGRPARMEAGRLQDRADLMQRLLQVAVSPAVDGRRARVGPDQAEQHPQRGRLPGPVRAEETGHGALLDLETHLVDREYLAKSLGQAAHLDHCHDLSIRVLAAHAGLRAA
jgi:hypothetical protein